MNIRKIINKYFTNKILFELIKRSKRFKYYNSLKNQQFFSLEKNLQNQQKFLFELVNYACKNIPYYKSLNISYSYDTIFDDIKKFPILTKEIIRKNFDKLINRGIDRKFINNTSGGTTGEPVILLQDEKFIDYGFATKILFNEWAGRKEGDLMFKIWGNEKEIFNGNKKTVLEEIKEYLLAVKVINSFNLDNNKIQAIIKSIEKEKPKLVLAYVQSIYEISKYIEENNIKISFKPVVMTSAGILTPVIKEYLEKHIASKVFNRYGSRECGDMACSCPNNTNIIHLNILTHFFEVINDKGEDLLKNNKSGKGKILVTPLFNYVMPLIRYEIGDVVEIDNTIEHDCKIGLPIIKNIIGREVNIFKTSDGKKIDGEYFTHLFYFKKGLKKFKVIQHDYEKIEIKIVGELCKDEIYKIEKKIKLLMGKDCKIIWNNVNEIQPTESGKFLYTISKI